MTTLVKRKLEYADRFALQQADQAIRRDVIRALVELITNCDDSYHRLEDAGHISTRQIVIEVQRRHKNSVVHVRDYAEGLSGDQMDKNVGTYGEATSGFIDGRSVRGLWGRGLKDAIYGLGHGYVRSIKESQLHECSLSIRDGVPTFELEQPIRATRRVRSQYGVPTGNGTIIEVVISRSDVTVPQFDSSRRYLERHFELRGIMSNPNRQVLLRELDGRGKIKQEVHLAYKAPVGNLILDDVLPIPDFPAEVHLEFYRSDIPLSMPAEERDIADGGLLIVSKHVVLSLTLLKFENNQYASRFYGRVTCDYLHDLLRREPPEPVLTSTRDGINWTHPFTKALKVLVESKLEPFIEEERKRTESEQRVAINKQLRKRFDDALKELNSIAKLELGNSTGDTDDDGDVPGHKPIVSPSGFGFVPEYVQIQTGKPSILTIRARVPDILASGNLITIESDSPEVMIHTPRVVLESRADYPEIGQAHVQIEGRQVGADAIITARVNSLQADARVKVVSKKEHAVEPPPKTRGGLFRDIKFDPNAEPKVRVRFDRDTLIIHIATKAPSVSPYLDESGKGSESAQGQVLLAELVSDAVCNAIAQRGVERGTFIAVKGSETDAIRTQYIRLQSQYAHVIHACFVEPEYRGEKHEEPIRKGRPKLVEEVALA